MRKHHAVDNSAVHVLDCLTAHGAHTYLRVPEVGLNPLPDLTGVQHVAQVQESHLQAPNTIRMSMLKTAQSQTEMTL